MPTLKVILDYPASSLALNSDFTQVVIAGSHIFKIFAIGDCELTEKANLFVAKDYNFSSSDVVWNPIDENRIATVATNGAVVTWDLNKSTRSKLDHSFKDHERPVNKVSFHPNESHLLISGLQGGLMKLFDTRRCEPVTTFTCNTESIKNIQFSPQINNYFAAGTDNGIVQFWDTRKPDRPENQFTEHRGPVFGLDWHPECRYWIATASRDRTIKVWDLSEPSNLCKSIRSMQSVWRVKWRPRKKFHLASCTLIDSSINVWDVRRPYIPFSSFHEHKNVATGIAWKGNSEILLSVGKDSTLIYNSMEDATHPMENTNPAALGINPHGLIAAAKPKEEETDYSLYKRRKPSVVNDFFGPVFSEMHIYDVFDQDVTSISRNIVECATNYRLAGTSLHEICEHNAAVDRRLNRHKEALTWQMVQMLYAGVTPASADGISYKEEQRNDSNTDSDQKHVRHISGDTGLDTPAGPMSAEDPDTETDDTDNNDMKLMHIASGAAIPPDYFFGDEESLELKFDFDSGSQFDANNQCWMLPNEAFQPRKNIMCRSSTPPPDGFPAANTQKEESSQLHGPEDTRSIGGMEYVMADCLRISEIEFEPTPPMDFTPLIGDVMRHYAKIGDIQMAVSLVIVLGDRVKNLVEEPTLEHWFLSYIEILHKLHLWNTASEVIQFAHGIPQVQEMNKQETSLNLQCGSCGHNLQYTDTFCRKCDNVPPSRCAVCHSVVKGLFVWCQECSHGGHLQHMFDWIKDNRSCPAGCGHHCEYN